MKEESLLRKTIRQIALVIIFFIIIFCIKHFYTKYCFKEENIFSATSTEECKVSPRDFENEEDMYNYIMVCEATRDLEARYGS
jgi:hypothetical protein